MFLDIITKLLISFVLNLLQVFNTYQDFEQKFMNFIAVIRNLIPMVILNRNL